MLLVGLLVPGARTAQALPAETVVLVRGSGDEPGCWQSAERRTRDELRMMGMGVVEVEVREDRAAIERALAEHGARLAIRVAREGDTGGAAVWWVDPDGGELRAERIAGLATEGPGAAGVAALRAAELVRAQTQVRGEGGRKAGAGDRSREGAGDGVEAGARDMLLPEAPPRAAADAAGGSWAPPDAAGGRVAETVAPAEAGVRDRLASRGVLDPLDFVEAAPPPEQPARPARATDGAGDRAVGLYAAVGGGRGGAGARVGGGIALRWHVTRRLAVQVEAQGATSPFWLSGQGYSFRAGTAGVQAGLVFVARRDARVSFRLGLGGGAALAWALARSPDRARSSQDRVIVGTVGASAQAAIRVRAHLRLVVGGDVALLLPPVAVRVQGAEVARFGAPLVRGALGLEWDWWSRARR